MSVEEAKENYTLHKVYGEYMRKYTLDADSVVKKLSEWGEKYVGKQDDKGNKLCGSKTTKAIERAIANIPYIVDKDNVDHNVALPRRCAFWVPLI